MNQHQSTPYVVIGGGIAGLSAALFLAEKGHQVELWEKEKQLGGLLAPVDFCGIPCDRGSHRLHPKAEPLVLSLTKEEQWLERPRKGKLILGGKHIPYPPNPLSFLHGLGLGTSLAMGLSFLTHPPAFKKFLQWEEDRKNTNDEDIGFASFVIDRVGHKAYEEFYRPYVNKVWGLPPEELSQTIAKKRVSTSKPLETILSSLPFRKQEKTAKTFLYPTSGMSGLIRCLEKKVLAKGVTIKQKHFGSQDLEQLKKKAAVFYTGRISDLVPDTKLTHKGLYLVYISVSKGCLKDVDTFYSPEEEFWFGRVSQIEKFSPQLSNLDKGVLCLEIPEGKWGKDVCFQSKIETIKQQLVKADILGKETEVFNTKQVYLSDVYPVFTKNWLLEWKRTMQQLVESNVFPIGRQGLFLHCNLDQVVTISREATSFVMQGGNVRDWVERSLGFMDLRVRD